MTRKETQPEAARFDQWLKLADLIVKGLLGLLASGVIAYVGLAFQDRWHQQEQANKAYQAVQESLAKQKDLDINLSLKMFETLMSQYLRADRDLAPPDRARQQLLLLQLIALNFQDTPLNLKPLFQHLAGQLSEPTLRQQLQDLAIQVANRQAFRLTLQNGLDYGRITVRAGDEVPLPELASRLQVSELIDAGVVLLLRSQITARERTIGPFLVTYFDLPIVDNTKIGEKRVAVTLLNHDGQTAALRVIIFDSYLAADRFDIKESTKELGTLDWGRPR